MSDGRPARRSLGMLAVLAAAGLSTACVSTRPWRPCGPPCGGPQLARARGVLVDTRDGTRLLLQGATPGEDEHGPFLAGKGRVGDRELGGVKVYDDAVCAVHTRRVEPRRVAANVVLVPLAVAGVWLLIEGGGDLSGLDAWDGWGVAGGELPPPCQPGGESAAADRSSSHARST